MRMSSRFLKIVSKKKSGGFIQYYLAVLHKRPLFLPLSLMVGPLLKTASHQIREKRKEGQVKEDAS